MLLKSSKLICAVFYVIVTFATISLQATDIQFYNDYQTLYVTVVYTDSAQNTNSVMFLTKGNYTPILKRSDIQDILVANTPSGERVSLLALLDAELTSHDQDAVQSAKIIQAAIKPLAQAVEDMQEFQSYNTVDCRVEITSISLPCGFYCKLLCK